MFENVLVGIDGKTGGRDAIALAQRLAAPNAKLTLAHVHHHESADEMLEAERTASQVEAELISVKCSSPGRGLHQQAEEQQADLLVVGSTSRGALGRAALGDDTRAALNGSPCAVAIAARGYAEHPIPFAKVGVGYNDSSESQAALVAAHEIARPTKAAVRVLEVMPIMTYGYIGMAPPVGVADVEEQLAEASSRLAQLPDVQGEAVFGMAGEELAAFSSQVDILVVGSRGYGPLRRLVIGSTSEYLERHARCSLLVLPRG